MDRRESSGGTLKNLKIISNVESTLYLKQIKIYRDKANPSSAYICSMQIQAGKKIYFLSDFHLGAPDPVSSLEREKIIVRFLDEIKHDAAEILLYQ